MSNTSGKREMSKDATERVDQSLRVPGDGVYCCTNSLYEVCEKGYLFKHCLEPTYLTLEKGNTLPFSQC